MSATFTVKHTTCSFVKGPKGSIFLSSGVICY